jgi:hypothetical protein
MEGDSKNEGEKQTKNSNTISDDSDVSEHPRVRCRSANLDQVNRFLILCEFGYVLPCGIILWTLFLIFWK